MLPRASLLAAILSASTALALRVQPPAFTDTLARCVGTACLSASLLGAPLASSAAQTLDEAIVEVSEASYPIIRGLDAKTFVPFTEKIGGLLLSLPSAKLGASIDAAIDVFDSVSPDKLKALNGAVGDAFGGLNVDSCTLVPLPSKAVAEKVQGVAAETVSPDKLKAFGSTWGPTLDALPKTDAAICLPPVAALDKLALAQAEVARSFGATEQAALAKVAVPMLKSKFSLGTVLPLVDDAKKVGANASPQEKAAFQAAGKRIEAAAKLDAAKRRSAEQAAAAQASKAAAAAAADPAQAAAVREEQRAAAAAAKQAAAAKSEAAAAEAAAKSRATSEARAAEQARLKEAETARIAELKAKAAAIAAAKATGATSP